MRALSFKKWFAKLPALNLPQRLQTLAALHPAAGLEQVIALIGQIGATQRRCPGSTGKCCWSATAMERIGASRANMALHTRR